MKTSPHFSIFILGLLVLTLGGSNCAVKEPKPRLVASGTVEFVKYIAPAGTGYATNKSGQGYEITVIPTVKPKTFYDSYVGASFRAPGNLCSIQFRAVDYPWKMYLIQADGRQLWGAASAYKTGSYADFVTLTTGALYRLVFAHPGATAEPVRYEGIAVNCESGDYAVRSPSLAERVQNEIIAPVLARQDENRIPREKELRRAFEKQAARLRELVRFHADDATIRDFLLRAAGDTRQLLLNAHGDKIEGRDERLVFVTYLAHFSVHLSYAADPEAREILVAGNGTCWQQAQVAEFIYRLMTGKQAQISSLDWLVIGHTIVAGEDFLIDATHNIVIFVSPEEWGRMSPARRILALEKDAVFGYSRDLNRAKPSPFAKALGGAEFLRAHWQELVSKYPFTTVCCSIINTAAQPNFE